MRRYWFPKSALVSPTDVLIEGDTLHHIRDVCRLGIGSKFEVIVEGGHALLVEIVTETKRESVAKVLEVRQIPDIPKPHIHLALSIPRFPVFEAVLEKSVELGVHSVQPFFSDFSFIRKQEDTFLKKRPRFEKIVVSATQQSGRGNLMPIAQPIGLEEVLANFNRQTEVQGLFAYEGVGVLSAQEATRAMMAAGGPQPQEIWIFVGSEGGFSEREVALFQAAGLKPVTLGAQVLRVETACVALVSIIKYAFDLMR